MNALTSLNSPAVLSECALAATAAITLPFRSLPGGATAAPVAATAATVPSWARTTVQVVLPAPLIAVTRRISAPMAIEKFGAGNPASLATVMDVCVVVAIGDASVVMAVKKPAAAWTAPSVVAMFACVIWLVVVHPPLILADGGVSR